MLSSRGFGRAFVTAASILAIIVLALSSVIVIYAQGTRDRYRPLIGGIQIELRRYYGSYLIYRNYCTIGYATRHNSTNQLGIITAAHCANWTTDIAVFQPELSYAVPDYNYIGTPSCVGNNTHDLAFIPYSNVACRILDTQGGTITQLNVSRISNWDELYYEVEILMKRPSVCKTGRSTNTTCGIIYSVREICEYGYRYCIYTQMNATYGDSGAPLYSNYLVGGGVILYGHLKTGISGYNIVIYHHVRLALELGFTPIVCGG